MRRTLPLLLAVFLAVAAGGWCISWFAQAAEARKMVDQAIASLNEKQRYVTYDAIETSGFPFDVVVSIVKPHFSGR